VHRTGAPAVHARASCCFPGVGVHRWKWRMCLLQLDSRKICFNERNVSLLNGSKLPKWSSSVPFIFSQSSDGQWLPLWNQSRKKPSHRWLIVGGSSSVRSWLGKRKWMLFRSHTGLPFVFVLQVVLGMCIHRFIHRWVIQLQRPYLHIVKE
jgi:hypothetical protein